MFFDETVTSFRGKYEFLSNFYTASVSICGYEFNTVEHAYVFAKIVHNAPGLFNNLELYKILINKSPGSAKIFGTIATIESWENVKLEFMLDLIRQKFDPVLNPELHSKLLATGDSVLEEGNVWGDEFWGINRHSGKGKNILGNLLMQVRHFYETNR